MQYRPFVFDLFLDLSTVQPNTDTEIKDPYSDWLKKDFAMATR